MAELIPCSADDLIVLEGHGKIPYPEQAPD